MNNMSKRLSSGPALGLAVVMAGILFAGCATAPPKEKPVHERGWVGGEYKLAQRPRFFGNSDVVNVLPAELDCAHRAGLLVKALATNAPAWQAGLRPGDLVIEVAHRPLTNLADFYLAVDRSTPGQTLNVKVRRPGGMTELSVVVGREKFRNAGIFSVSLPPVLRPPDLWPVHGFSLVALGYEPEAIKREQLDSVVNTYRRASGGKGDIQNMEWQAWAAIFQVSRSKTILAQEAVPAATPAEAARP